MAYEEDLKEFRQEGSELLEAAEKALLALEDGANYKSEYDAIFRAFHNLKGAAGMMDIFMLQAHTHVLETELVSLKNNDALTSVQVDYFLKGIDYARRLLNGEEISEEDLGKMYNQYERTDKNDKKQRAEEIQDIAAFSEPLVIEKHEPEQKIVLQDHKKEHNLPESYTKSFVEPNRVLMFAEGTELVEYAQHLRECGFDVTHVTDYIEGITKYDEVKPHVIFISPDFKQTTSEELKSILKKTDPSEQMFIDFDFLSTPKIMILNYIRTLFAQRNSQILLEKASDLLKFQYSDLSEYLLTQGKTHVEQILSEDIKSFLNLKYQLDEKFKIAV
ncbi:MAG: Hpt domain-containing protein [Pseudobdellovibrio sp.]